MAVELTNDKASTSFSTSNNKMIVCDDPIFKETKQPKKLDVKTLQTRSDMESLHRAGVAMMRRASQNFCKRIGASEEVLRCTRLSVESDAAVKMLKMMAKINGAN
jgi:hypothetical protein